MSGSTIGGIAGAAIGFVVSGFNPYGAQIGWMIGSAVGGYVDPERISGPRLTDAMQQTSRDGVPIPFGFGVFPTAGNVIWRSELREVPKKERQGKGGPVVTTYSYLRSYAIGICEGPITGLLMIKRNGKIVYDARSEEVLQELHGDTPTEVLRNFVRQQQAQRGSFLNKVTIYLGDETQLPDPTIEAVEGVGNVAPFRGLAYIVVTDDDQTELGGAIPQYEFVVAANATTVPGDPEIGAVTHSQVLGSDPRTTYVNAMLNGVRYMASPNIVNVGEMFEVGTMSNELAITGSSAIENAGNGPGDTRIIPLASSGAWMVGEDGTSGYCELHQGGSFAADLRPYADSPSSWFYAQSFYSPEYGGLIGFASTAVYMLVRKVGSPAVVHNRIYKWALQDTGGAVLLPSAISVDISAEANYASSYFHTDRFDSPWALNTAEGVLYEFDSNLFVVQTYDASAVGSCYGFGVDSATLFTLHDAPGGGAGRELRAYRLSDMMLVGTVTLPEPAGGWSSVNHRISFGMESIFVQSGNYVCRIDYRPECLGGLPEGYVELPDAPGYATSPTGEVVKIDCALLGETMTPAGVPLSTIVAGLVERAGLTAGDYDVSQLTDLVTGYRVATEAGADAMIAPLQQAYFFDVGEWDGKLRFIKRGGNAALSLGPDDFVERDGDAVDLERVQEAELLRGVTVSYIDPRASYTVTTQKAERRAGTIEAKGEGSVELPIVADADDAATMAKKRLAVAWSETDKLRFTLAQKWAKVTPTDVCEVLLPDGNTLRARAMSVEEDSGRFEIEAIRDRQAAYTGTATGVRPKPPTIIDPPLIGPTRLAVMDLPVLAEADDALGVYVAARGYLPGWPGAEVQLSTDSGANYAAAAQVTVPATIGSTTTDLAAWASAEYPSVQSVTVYLPDAPESITYEALLRYGNRAALQLDDGTWEVLQYQTVVDNGSNSYTLSGLLRGRYGTTPGVAAAGATFVLLDSAVRFVPCERWMIGETLTVRAVSYGTDPDAVTGTDFTLTGASQTEWPPHDVQASRDGSDNVTVTWIGRGRLGTETAPFHSQHFTGYRVTFSDGHTADVTDTTYTRSSTPPGVTVSVAALNSITGAGPSSETVNT